MTIREANINDIDAYMEVRMSVKENILSNPALVTHQDNIEYLTTHGKGWVCEIDKRIIGFSIVGLKQRNIWALFVHPDFERGGIGRKLHDVMIDWYFTQTKDTVWLGTSPGTRAEMFYRKSGWKETGMHGKNEIKFEMDFVEWMVQKTKRSESENKE
ncbi:hypothetical protein BH11BAC1_BH11BAC1_12510 [soil metagenome]